MALFFRERMASERRKDAALDLVMKARAVLRVDDDTVVSISEHACGDSECCGTRTVVLVMRPDQPTEAVKFNKPIENVTQADLAAALAPLAAPGGASEAHPQRT
jgi:hypothetical protein